MKLNHIELTSRILICLSEVLVMTPGPDAHTARRRGDMLSSTRQLQRAVPRGFPAAAVETLRETLASQQVRARPLPEPSVPMRLAAVRMMIIFRPSEPPRHDRQPTDRPTRASSPRRSSPEMRPPSR